MKNIIKKFIPQFILSWYHFGLAALAAFFYGFPSKDLIVIGITGTNGKSTVVNLTTKILEESGYKVASLSSIKFKIGKEERKNTLKMTMPGRFKIQRFLRKAVNASCQYAVLEITSEGILQYRHRFIDFNVAVITNLTPEHIESHGSFKKYKEAKGKLFKSLKQLRGNKQEVISIVNLDDENAEYFLKFPVDKRYGYGLETSNFQFSSSNFQTVVSQENQIFNNGIKFSINKTEFNLKLLGKFNIYNSLTAICVGLSQRIDLKVCKSALEKIDGIPGRMEEVISQPFKVIVDYAHTPDALEKVYETISNKRLTIDNKFVCVLGSCGGGRDIWKRPELGKIAARYCDKIILTNEDPYDENPGQILSEIKSGVSDSKLQILKIILDRRQAIYEALKTSRSGDIIVITGKGCESWMCVADGKKVSWDDREVVRQEFKKIKLNKNN